MNLPCQSDHAMNDSALTLLRAGRFTEAAAVCRSALDADPNDADSLHWLGLIAAEQSDPHGGIRLIRQAMALDPNRAAHCNSLGQAYRRLGWLEDAAGAYRAAAAIRPDSAEIHSNLATVLRDLGDHGMAAGHYRLAAELAPGSAVMWYNLANALSDSGSPEEAEACYRRAIGLKPDFVHALANYGRWLIDVGRWADARDVLIQAERLAPDYVPALANLGIALQELGAAEAEDRYRRAIVLEPGTASFHCNLGRWLFEQGRTDEAIACHAAALAIDPAFGAARLGLCMTQLPILYLSDDEVPVRRLRYARALEALGAEAEPAGLADAAGAAQPFFLPYQGEDDRALQALYGATVCRALARAASPVVLAGRPSQGERIRIGIVSGSFCDHTLFKLFLEGWLTELDRSRFEVTGFHTGRISDAVTARCAELCDRFVRGLPSGGAWQAAIGAAAPHVLLYPEVGIDPVAGRLAAMRLAPVQCAAWGHPVTTGLPTIDYFLSSAAMEPREAEAYYTERLVRLPGLGLCYTPDPMPWPEVAGGHDAALVRDPADPGAPVFWSGQALYKYLPRYDAMFPRIAAALGRCRFVFIAFARSQALTDMFRARLGAAFAAAGLDVDRYVTILPPLSQHDYLEAVARADIILDTPGWSGGKSTLDCLAANPAIVTLPGRFMRGRHTAAILRRIGCEATIAGSEDDYVAIAVRLARDPVWRADIRRTVASGKHRAFRDTTSIRALETFLADAVG